MTDKKVYFGFGFCPQESSHHFILSIPKEKEGMVVVYERFTWQDTDTPLSINPYVDRAKAAVSKHKWQLMEETLKVEFNNRLKKEKIKQGSFSSGFTPVNRMLGKELLVFMWAVEDCDPKVIPAASVNWLGLEPEERWWLYTMTNAASGGKDDRRGWRKALRYALTENPIEDQRQISMFDAMLYRKDDE